MTRFTADDARRGNADELDDRIRAAVQDSGYDSETGHRYAYLRIYAADSFRHTIRSELEARGFFNVIVPDIVLKGDVYFEWEP